MYIIFKKACVFNKKKRFLGSVTNVIHKVGIELIEAGLAEEYFGEVPPKKLKTNFFNPKK
jgi:hypothetical protein